MLAPKVPSVGGAFQYSADAKMLFAWGARELDPAIFRSGIGFGWPAARTALKGKPMTVRLHRLVPISALASAAALLGVALTSRGGAAPAAAPNVVVCRPPSPGVPAGFDYPQTAATVEKWVKDGDVSRTRRHGWYLWAGINSPAPSGLPVWRAWCTSTQAFIPTALPPTALAATAAETSLQANARPGLNAKRRAKGLTVSNPGDPIEEPGAPFYPPPDFVVRQEPRCYNSGGDGLKDGPVYQYEGNVMIAGVIYNDAAYRWIRDKRLYLQSTFNPQVPDPGKFAQIEEFPTDAMVLKPMFWPVRGDGYTALPLFDADLLPPPVDNGSYAGFEIQKRWPRAVAVTTRPDPKVTHTRVSYLYGAYASNTLRAKRLPQIVYPDAAVVGTDQFYRFAPDPATLSPCDRAIVDASAYAAYGRAFQKGDQLILIAMHIMTKEQHAWTFQSFWWHDRPKVGPHAADRPVIPQARGPWDHYLMASTYGIPTSPGSGQWPIAYNPYIELAADHPIATNCMNCHHRASWPGALASYLDTTPGSPGALDVYGKTNPILQGMLTLDAQWSVSNRATVSPMAGQGGGGGGRR
jgi:hypothetical protein